MKGPILPLDEYHARLWAGHFRFYLSLPLERRPAYRQLMKLYFPLLRSITSFVELHLAYEELEEGPWYENRAQLLVPDIPPARALAIARDTAFYLYHRRLSLKEAGRSRRSDRRSR